MKELVEDEHYYNNSFEVNDEIVNIDGVYMVDEYKFSEEDYNCLSKIYRSLPGFIGYTPCPSWFGTADDNSTSQCYLLISFEPSGLQLMGTLKLQGFLEWEQAFHGLLEKASFPFKYE